MLAGTIDLAVHSHKDLPTTNPDGLIVAGVSRREDPSELLLIRKEAVNDSKKFSLKENSLVKLNVYDLQGREVANVINDRRDGGNYEITFDANNFNLSSGTYFYNIQVQGSTSDFTETKKMFLIK